MSDGRDNWREVRLKSICRQITVGHVGPLMQTIARANRVFGSKPNGLIVDYIGVFRNLQRALAIYGAPTGDGEEYPPATSISWSRSCVRPSTRPRPFAPTRGLFWLTSKRAKVSSVPGSSKTRSTSW
jgi:hypothetical protein